MTQMEDTGVDVAGIVLSRFEQDPARAWTLEELCRGLDKDAVLAAIGFWLHRGRIEWDDYGGGWRLAAPAV